MSRVQGISRALLAPIAGTRECWTDGSSSSDVSVSVRVATPFANLSLSSSPHQSLHLRHAVCQDFNDERLVIRVTPPRSREDAAAPSAAFLPASTRDSPSRQLVHVLKLTVSSPTANAAFLPALSRRSPYSVCRLLTAPYSSQNSQIVPKCSQVLPNWVEALLFCSTCSLFLRCSCISRSDSILRQLSRPSQRRRPPPSAALPLPGRRPSSLNNASSPQDRQDVHGQEALACRCQTSTPSSDSHVLVRRDAPPRRQTPRRCVNNHSLTSFIVCLLVRTS